MRRSVRRSANGACASARTSLPEHALHGTLSHICSAANGTSRPPRSTQRFVATDRWRTVAQWLAGRPGRPTRSADRRDVHRRRARRARRRGPRRARRVGVRRGGGRLRRRQRPPGRARARALAVPAARGARSSGPPSPSSPWCFGGTGWRSRRSSPRWRSSCSSGSSRRWSAGSVRPRPSVPTSTLAATCP